MLRAMLLALALCTQPLAAQDKAFDLSAPPALVETGFLKHILPRFSLKTGIRITVVDGDALAAFGDDGVPVFRQGDRVWSFSHPDTAATVRFAEWLASDVGKRTIDGFKRDGVAMFNSDVSVRRVEVEETLSGDAALGEKLSLAQCGRCHVINKSNRMNAIGSSPSFALMRSFGDWQERFRTFFLLKPHPAFTQVAEVTDPFPEHLPSPIAPIEVTLDEIEAILAFVGSLKPADLGAPIQFQ